MKRNVAGHDRTPVGFGARSEQSQTGPMNIELEPERLIHASDGHFITEGGGYVLRAYVGEPPAWLAAPSPEAEGGG
jgi:hypothetical protein